MTTKNLTSAELKSLLLGRVNALLLTLTLTVGGWVGTRLIGKADANNDLLIAVNGRLLAVEMQINKCVSQREYDVAIEAIRSRLTKLDLDIEKLRNP